MALFNPAIINFPKSPSTISTETLSSNVSVILIPEKPERIGAIVWNKSTSDLYIDFDETVTLTSFSVKLAPDGYYELPFNYTGAISGIWESVNGMAISREFI